jgi:hypothetical protein
MTKAESHEPATYSLAMVSIKDTREKAEPDRRGVHGDAAVWLMGQRSNGEGRFISNKACQFSSSSSDTKSCSSIGAYTDA